MSNSRMLTQIVCSTQTQKDCGQTVIMDDSGPKEFIENSVIEIVKLDDRPNEPIT